MTHFKPESNGSGISFKPVIPSARAVALVALLVLAGCGSETNQNGIDPAAGTGQSLPVSAGQASQVFKVVGPEAQLVDTGIRPLVVVNPPPPSPSPSASNLFSVRADYSKLVYLFYEWDGLVPIHSSAFTLISGYLPGPGDSNSYPAPQPSYSFTARGNGNPSTPFLEILTAIQDLSFDPLNPANASLFPQIPIPASSADDGSSITVTSLDGNDTATFTAGPAPSFLNETVTVSKGPFSENITVSPGTGSAALGNDWSLFGQTQPRVIVGGTHPTIQRQFYYTPKPKQIKITNPTATQVSTNTTLNFGISAVNTTLKQWSVDLKQNDNIIMSFAPTNDTHGPGVSQGNNPYNISLTWDGRDKNNQTVVGNYTWVMAANTTEAVGPNNNDGVNSTLATLVASANSGKITIDRAVPDPVSFDPANGESSTLSFDISTHDISQPTINWQVSILDANNVTFHTFKAGSSNDGSTSVHLSQNWSGKNNAGNVINGAFTWVVAANTTTQVAGQGGGGDAAQPYYALGSAGPNKMTLTFNQSSVPPRWLMQPDKNDLQSDDPDLADYLKTSSSHFPDATYKGYAKILLHLEGADKNTKQTVRLVAQGVSNSGGHFHTDPNYPRPTGSFLVQPQSSSNQLELVTQDGATKPARFNVQVPTDSAGAGNLTVFYLPSEFSGQEKILAVQLNSNGGATSTRTENTLDVQIPDLVDLSHDSTFKIDNGTTNGVKVAFEQSSVSASGTDHTDTQGNYQGYYMKSGSATHLRKGFQEFCNFYRKKWGDTLQSLSLNDMSMVGGGKLDFRNQWNRGVSSGTPYTDPFDTLLNQAHRYHRRGNSVDINYAVFASGAQISLVNARLADLDVFMNRQHWKRVDEAKSIHYDYIGGVTTANVDFVDLAADPVVQSQSPRGQLASLFRWPGLNFLPRNLRGTLWRAGLLAADFTGGVSR
jgi:hypothetical protein